MSPSPEPPAARAATTESRFLSSSLAAYGSQLGRTALRLVGELTLARLILPEEHGVFDLALAIVVLVALVRDLGLPYHLVRDERRPYGTVLAWVVGASIALAAALALAAPLFAGFDPELPPVLRVFALFLVLDGLAVVPRVFFESRLEVGRLVAPEIVRGSVFLVVSVVLALSGAAVWSFVAGELVAALVFALLVWKRAWGRMPLAVEPRLLGDLLYKSRYLFLIALAAVSLPQIAALILGLYAEAAIVGYFVKARAWGFRLQLLVLPAVARVIYPTLVEYRFDEHRFAGAYRLGTLSILCLETLAAYFLFFNAKVVLVDVLLGESWMGAVPLIQILCFAPLIDPFSRLGGEVLKVRQEDRAWLIVVLANGASLLLFGFLLTARFGAAGLAWAHYLLLGNLLMTWRVWRALGAAFWRLLRDLLFVYLMPLPLFAAVAWWLPAESWERFAASILVAGAVGGLYLLRFQRSFRDFFGARPAQGGA